MRVVNRRRVAALIVLASLVALFITWMNWIPSAPTRKHKVVTAQLPLTFEVNRGQAAADAKFVARGSGYALLLTDRGEPVLALHGRPRRPVQPHSERNRQARRADELREPAERVLLRLEFPGSNPAPLVQGEQPMPGHSNYLTGNDPKKWLTGVPHYARVRYHEVYSGVDLLYYAKDQQVEYDFIVRPGTNPDSIRLRVKGAQGIDRGELGSLALKTAAGRVLLNKPVAYQQGPDGEREVACNYLLDKGEVRFALGDYDRSQVLRIDPVLSYAARLDAFINAIAVDASGNSYLAGTTHSANFPTTPGAFQPTHGGTSDALIAKLDPTGSTLLFATYLGGSGRDFAGGIALDSSGNVIVAGYTDSANFPTANAFQSACASCPSTNFDAFVTKLNATGMQVLYSTYLGGLGLDLASGVALDASGRVLVTGSTNSSNFPTSTGAYQAAYGGNDDAFIAKVDTTKSGTASLLFSTYLGGSGEDAGSAIALNAEGFAFVTGRTRSANFPTANAFQSACASCAAPILEYDAFVSKLNPNATALVYSTFLGGNARDTASDIVVDSIGNAYVAGHTSSNDFPITTGAFQTSFHGLADAFVTKLNTAGAALQYSSFIGGGDFDAATGIALDSSGNAYLSGLSSSADFPTVNPLQGYGGGACDINGFGFGPCSDAIVTQINTSGSMLIFSTHLGGGADDFGAGIAVDTAGNAFVAGTAGVTFPSTQGALQMSGAGFAAKISRVNTGTQPTSATLTSSPNPSNQGQSVTFTATVTPVGATGLVIFRDGNTVIGSASLNDSGLAAFSPSSFSGASHSITVEYLGDADFAPSTSTVLTQVVNSISLMAAQTSATVSRGGTATFPLTVGQAGALTSAIAFSCSGLPVGWNCGFNPMTVPAGSGPTQVTLTLQVGSATAQSLPRTPIMESPLPDNAWLGAVALLMLGFLLAVRRRKLVWPRSAAVLGLTSLLLLVAGCGGVSDRQSPPQPVTANFTVNAASGSTTASTTLIITVR